MSSSSSVSLTPVAVSGSNGTEFKKGLSLQRTDGAGLRVAIVYARWNSAIVGSMKAGAIKAMAECGVNVEKDVIEIPVPGSYELPFACKSVITKSQAEGQRIDAVIALGCLIKGETMHFEYICSSVSQGLQDVQLSTGVPVLFGVLTCLTEAQAEARSGVAKKGHNHGLDYGYGAVEMAKMKFDKYISTPIKAKL